MVFVFFTVISNRVVQKSYISWSKHETDFIKYRKNLLEKWTCALLSFKDTTIAFYLLVNIEPGQEKRCILWLHHKATSIHSVQPTNFAHSFGAVPGFIVPISVMISVQGQSSNPKNKVKRREYIYSETKRDNHSNINHIIIYGYILQRHAMFLGIFCPLDTAVIQPSALRRRTLLDKECPGWQWRATTFHK